jgi:hypothetical protein
MRKSKVSKTAAKVIAVAISDTLNLCRTPEERAVLVNLNNNIIKQWDIGNISMESVDIMVDCFDRERAKLAEK